MTEHGSDRTLAALTALLDDAHLATPGRLSDVVLKAAGELGWTAELYLVDYDQRVLTPVPSSARPAGPVQAVDGTLAGRAFRTVAAAHGTGPDAPVWLPLIDGVERLGVIRLTVPPDTDVDSDVFRADSRHFGQLVGHLVASKSPYGDALDRLRRRRPRTVATELLWSLLPPLTFACEGLVLSGLLEPCYDVAADAFDYGICEDDVVRMAVFDATGHDLSGTLLVAVALAAYRTSRREDASLEATARAIDEAVEEQGRGHRFVSGVLAELDLATGRLRYVIAGHPSPLLLRRSHVVKVLQGHRRILFGLGRGETQVAEEWLERDDWIVFYTDGITEARDHAGRLFGIDRLTDMLEMAAAGAQPAPETLRRVVHAVLDHQQGVLQDDATILFAQWASGREAELTSE